MKKRVAGEQEGTRSKWTLAQAASTLGLERRQIKDWRTSFPIFETRGDTLTAHDLRALRALKALLIEHDYTHDDAMRLFDEQGAAVVIAAYAPARVAPLAGNPAHALQQAVRSAAAAGFFGEVYACMDDDARAEEHAPRVASYAHARLARLK